MSKTKMKSKDTHGYKTCDTEHVTESKMKMKSKYKTRFKEQLRRVKNENEELIHAVRRHATRSM